ncbi:unnamed protein product [Rhizoctonia solani]|uniref:N-alpha-acetyltransferase 25, NatB auxiliary subunit n=1 Tax=Rhizoctonia solani TaxID=456999 RepID=A0A8H2ZUR9_9AGAM|nr:unnamed protein product [Rhizoctonia solani]
MSDRKLQPIYGEYNGSFVNTCLLMALQLCNKALKKQPDSALIKALKALALIRAGKLEECIALADQLVAAKPVDENTLSTLSHVLRALDRPQDVVNLYDDAYKQHPNNEELGCQAFIAMAKMGSWRTAQQTALRLNRTFPTSVPESRYAFWAISCMMMQAPLRMIEALPKPGAAATPDKVWLHIERNYVQFGGLIETTLAIIKKQQAGETPIPAPPAEGETESKPVLNSEELYAETVDVFTKISQKDGADERAAPLSLIQLEVDRRKSDVKLDSVAPDNLYTLLTKYFEKIGSKACCYDDLADAIASLPENGPELGKWIEFLENQTQDLTSVNGLRRAVNVAKMLRTGRPTVEKISPEDEVASARKHLKAYLDAAPICENYPETEQQPRDDLAILAASAMVSAYTGSGKASYLTQAIVILEFALSKSPYNARFRILLTRLYRLIGAPTLAHEHYKGLRIKQTQHDTLSYLVLARASTFCMAGDSELVGECIESSQIYTANVQETPELVARAFVGEKFAQIPNFVEFEEKLECSLQRDLTKMEHTRMRLGFEAQAVESLVLELQDLQLTIVRAHHDNRDMSVIPNYQPRGQNIVDQTSMGPSPGLPWLNVFLQIYIRALEDSLGPAHFTGREYSFDDESQLTPLEAEFRKFTDNLNEWLVIRELPKTDKAAPGENGAENTNGGSETPKNGADVPALAAGVIDYFEGLYKKFGEISKDETKLPWESLHIAGLAQEALVLFEIQSAQFKVPTTGKAKKEPVAQGIKGIRPRASKALKDLATAMVAFGEEAGSEAKQKSIIEDCKDLEEFAGAKAQTVVNNIAKRIAGARKSVFEGWGKGMLRSLI